MQVRSSGSFSGISGLKCVYVYIYILELTCAYPCTEFSLADSSVDFGPSLASSTAVLDQFHIDLDLFWTSLVGSSVGLDLFGTSLADSSTDLYPFWTSLANSSADLDAFWTRLADSSADLDPFLTSSAHSATDLDPFWTS